MHDGHTLSSAPRSFWAAIRKMAFETPERKGRGAAERGMDYLIPGQDWFVTPGGSEMARCRNCHTTWNGFKQCDCKVRTSPTGRLVHSLATLSPQRSPQLSPAAIMLPIRSIAQGRRLFASPSRGANSPAPRSRSPPAKNLSGSMSPTQPMRARVPVL